MSMESEYFVNTSYKTEIDTFANVCYFILQHVSELR